LHRLEPNGRSAALPNMNDLAETRGAWRQQADRIRELDYLLAQPAFVQTDSKASDTAATAPASRCEQTRQDNLARLRAVREQMHEHLLNTLAAARELVTRIHLAKYTGSPSLAELAQQINSLFTSSRENVVAQVDSATSPHRPPSESP
jgi:hypothetical protein